MNVGLVFKDYRLNEALAPEFERVVESTLVRDCPLLGKSIGEYRRVPGLYFWTMTFGADEFKIYLGKATNLGERIRFYCSPFQPHSVNDFKMQVFAAYLRERAPAAQLNFYVSPKDKSVLKDSENAAIAKFSPLLNRRMPPLAAERDSFEKAFSIYYRSCFERMLGSTDTEA